MKESCSFFCINWFTHVSFACSEVGFPFQIYKMLLGFLFVQVKKSGQRIRAALHAGPLLRSEWSVLPHTPQQRLAMLFRTTPKIACGDLDPIWYMVPWAHPSQPPKQHHDQFGRFFGRVRHNRQTHRPHYSICSSWLRLAIAVMWPKN